MGAIRHSQQTRARVIEEFRKSGRVDLATAACGVDRTMHYDWLRKHQDYRAAFEAARLETSQMLADEAWRRAHQGTTRPVFAGGQRVLDFELDENGKIKLDEHGQPVAVPAIIREYSDNLLMFLLEARDPRVYGRRRVDHRLVDEKDKDRSLTLEDVDRIIAEAEAEGDD